LEFYLFFVKQNLQMTRRMAKQMWMPQLTAPETRQEEEETWSIGESCTTSDKSMILFMAGSKIYALDAAIGEKDKTSDSFLRKRYRYFFHNI
jgi:hypothetical protein